MRVINALLFLALAAGLGFVALGVATPEFDYSTEIYVAAPVSESYAVYQDPERLGVWLDGFVSIQYLRGEPDAVGAFYRLTFQDGGEPVIFTEEITALVENELVSTTLDNPMMALDVSTRFAAEGEGTRLLTSNTVRPKGLFYRAFLRLRRGSLQARQASDYERLKRLIETE